LNKKPPELPNIEDATLRACLAPLMDAMNNGAGSSTAQVDPSTIPIAHPGADQAGRLSALPSALPNSPGGFPGSNDNRTPPADTMAVREHDCSLMPKTLAEWRSLADEDFGAFRMIEHFLGLTDAELETAAAEFPKQIGGTMKRIACLKSQLAVRYDAATTVSALLERAMARVTAGTSIERAAAKLAPCPSSGATP
jgi:hypothetical protein